LSIFSRISFHSSNFEFVSSKRLVPMFDSCVNFNQENANLSQNHKNLTISPIKYHHNINAKQVIQWLHLFSLLFKTFLCPNAQFQIYIFYFFVMSK
jgi:hypothetical protein